MPDCNTCRENRQSVPYIVYESAMARCERTIKRLWILVLVVVLLLVGSNVGWMIYESQFETITETTQEVWQEADSGGDNWFTGGDFIVSPESENNDTDIP